MTRYPDGSCNRALVTIVEWWSEVEDGVMLNPDIELREAWEIGEDAG